jgi:hypothetical protein
LVVANNNNKGWRHHRPSVEANNNNNNNKGAPVVANKNKGAPVVANNNNKGAPTVTAIRAKDLVPFGLKVLAEMVTTANLLMKDHLAAVMVVEEERASTKTITTTTTTTTTAAPLVDLVVTWVTVPPVLPTIRLAAVATQCRMLPRLEATITTWEVPSRLPTTAHLVAINPVQQHLLLEPGLRKPIRLLQAPSADLHLVRKECQGRLHRVRRLLVLLQAAASVAGLQLRRLLEVLLLQLRRLLVLLLQQFQAAALVAGLQLRRLLEVLQHQLHHRLEVLLQQLHRLLVLRLQQLHRLLVLRHQQLHRLLEGLPAVAMAETRRMLLPLVEVAETKTLRSGRTRELRLLVIQHRLRLHLEAVKIISMVVVVEEAEATSKVVLEETTKTHRLEEVGTALAINVQAVVRSPAPFGLQAVADTVTTVDFPTRDPPEEEGVAAAVEAVAAVISRLVVVVVSVATTTHLLVGQDDRKRATMEFYSLMGRTYPKKML